MLCHGSWFRPLKRDSFQDRRLASGIMSGIDAMPAGAAVGERYAEAQMVSLDSER